MRTETDLEEMREFAEDLDPDVGPLFGRDVAQLIEHFITLRDALKTISTTNDSGEWVKIYRATGGGYEGLQAIAEAALERVK